MAPFIAVAEVCRHVCTVPRYSLLVRTILSLGSPHLTTVVIQTLIAQCQRTAGSAWLALMEMHNSFPWQAYRSGGGWYQAPEPEDVPWGEVSRG